MHTWVKSALAAIAAGAAVVAVAMPASAQEVIVEDDAMLVVDEGPVIVDEGPAIVDGGEIFAEEGPAIVEETVVEDAIPVAERPGPRVYGWTGRRGGDCGMFHYWNGMRCVDARDEPPALR